jgi:hypothetical protein
MDSPEQTMDETRSDDSVESSTTLDYLCSQIPAEIRNTIYKLILDDTLPNYVFRHGIAISRPWLGDDPTVVNYLPFCSINKQIRAEFGSLLMSKVPLVISVNEISVSFATFLRRDCLTGVCGHGNHAVVPRQVTILVSGIDFINRRARNLYGILRGKAWDHNLKIEFIPQRAASDHDHMIRQSADGTCALLNRFLGNPPAVFLDAVKSGLIVMAKFKQGKGSVSYNEREGSIYYQQNGGRATSLIHKWKFGLRKSSGKLTKEDKNLLCSYCSQVMQCIRPESALQIEFLVGKDGKSRKSRKSPGERWVYCSSSKALLRSLPGRKYRRKQGRR